MHLKISLLLTGCAISFMTIAQDVDLDKIAQEEQQKETKNKINYTEGTFHTTRLINGHSIENLNAGILDMKISHRFGQLNGGFYQLFGLDNASMRWGLDYGVTPRLMVGLGRSTYQKQYDAFFKYKILRQSEGDQAMPLSVSVMSSIMLNSLKWEDPNRKNYFTSRLYYAFQILAARKFSEGTSLQIMPTMIHYNLVRNATDKNDLFALGIGGRQRITKRVSINAEYYYQLPGYKMAGTTNSFSLGFDIETGGHVFQLHFTNSPGMTERTFVSETFGTWPNGDILFGFNISRLFSIKKNKQ
jgi:hypothetical protein